MSRVTSDTSNCMKWEEDVYLSAALSRPQSTSVCHFLNYSSIVTETTDCGCTASNGGGNYGTTCVPDTAQTIVFQVYSVAKKGLAILYSLQ